MKNTLVVTSLVMVISYPLAALARSLGILPVELVSLPVFFGAFTAVNLLAITLASYSRRPTYGEHRARKAVAAPEPMAESIHATWACDTISA